VHPPVSLPAASDAYRITMYVVAAGAAFLSLGPALNMLSPNQLMNYSYNPLHLVNSYGAFGSITRERNEIVIEGTTDSVVSAATRWQEYEFRGKPGNPARRPPQVAPYHLRLDWLMWFAAMSRTPQDEWLPPLFRSLLEADPDTLSLLLADPFSGQRPRYVRALYYRYRFTTREERATTGEWWHRDLIGPFMPPISLASFQ
jgi:hypothetical protein